MCGHKIGRQSDLFMSSNHQIGRDEVSLPIKQKNYNFREKKISQLMKEREHLH